MSIEILSSSSYITTHENVSGGHMGTTNRASIEWSDGVARKSYVKAYPASDRCIKLCNEICGFLLAKAVGLNPPKHAALLELPEPLWPDYNIDKSLEISDIVWVWVTTETGKSVKSIFGLNNYDPSNQDHVLLAQQAICQMVSIECLHKLIAFDDLVGNDDRNIGNLTIDSTGTASIIDHGEIFGRNNWIVTPNQLNYFDKYTNLLLDWALIFFPRLLLGSQVLQSAHHHHAAYNSVRESLLHHLQAMLDYDDVPDAIKTRAMDCVCNFLHYRSQDLGGEFARRLGLVM